MINNFFFFKCSRTDGRNSSAEIIEKGDQPNDVHKRSLEIEKQVTVVPAYKQITDDVRRMVKTLCEEAFFLSRSEMGRRKSRRGEMHMVI